MTVNASRVVSFRLAVGLALWGLVALLLPASASSFTFGWSTSSNGDPVAIYDYASPCASSDGGADGALDAFKFTDPANPSDISIQMNYPRMNKSRRFLGNSLSDLRRENVRAQTDPAHYRVCEGTGPGDWTVNTNQDFNFTNPTTPNFFQTNPPQKWDPSTFTNSEWYYAPYLVPGSSPTVYSFLHNEYRGTYCNNNPSCTDDNLKCSPGLDFALSCWFASITMSKSDGTETQWDGSTPPSAPGTQGSMPYVRGAVFRHPRAATTAPSTKPYLVASIPYRYHKDWGRHGYTGASNVIKGPDGAYYLVVHVNQGSLDPNEEPFYSDGSDTQSYFAEQSEGACVLRSTNLGDASSWRAWDGQGFNRTLVDPYQWTPNPPSDTQADHRCEYISPDTLGMFTSPRSVRYDTYLKKYVLTTGSGTISYSLSDDLVNWSPKQLLMKADVAPCNEGALIYPSILDPNDPAQNAQVTNPNSEPNFNQPDRAAALSSQFAGCSAVPPNTNGFVGYKPFLFNLRHASFENGALVDSSADAPTGFDDASPVIPGQSVVSVANNFGYGPGDQHSMQAITFGLPSYGRYRACFSCPQSNVKWDTGSGNTGPSDAGTDVWYGGAFWVPQGFSANNHGVGLIRWQDPDDPGVYGGVFLNSNGYYQLVRGNAATQDQIGSVFDLSGYENNWAWIEVHQRFAPSNPVSEVYVNGQLVSTSKSANTFSTNNTVADRVDYGYASVPVNQPTGLLYVDEPFIDASARAAAYAPKTPTGLRKTLPALAPVPGQPLTVAWNAVDPGSGGTVYYHVYKCGSSTGNVWTQITTSPSYTSTSFTDSSYSDPSAYRVTADQRNTLGSTNGSVTTKESNPSAAIDPSRTYSPTCGSFGTGQP